MTPPADDPRDALAHPDIYGLIWHWTREAASACGLDYETACVAADLARIEAQRSDTLTALLSPVQAAEQDRLVVAYRETIARLMNERDTWRTQAVESAHWIGSILGALDLREDATPEDALNVARQARSAEQDAPEPPACGHVLADPERLASLEHLQWMAWASSILDSEPISDERRARWKALFVPYDELPEDMKEEDRKWARAVLAMGWDHEPVVDAAPPAAPTSEVMYLTDAVGWQGPPAAPTSGQDRLAATGEAVDDFIASMHEDDVDAGFHYTRDPKAGSVTWEVTSFGRVGRGPSLPAAVAAVEYDVTPALDEPVTGEPER